jgi:hypothetical protein
MVIHTVTLQKIKQETTHVHVIAAIKAVTTTIFVKTMRMNSLVLSTVQQEQETLDVKTQTLRVLYQPLALLLAQHALLALRYVVPVFLFIQTAAHQMKSAQLPHPIVGSASNLSVKQQRTVEKIRVANAGPSKSAKSIALNMSA